jgi:hypothetical protein
MFRKEGYSLFELKQWNSDKTTWTSLLSRPSIQECLSSEDFIGILKKATSFDFGNISIIFDPSNILEFKFIKEGNNISFDPRIKTTGKNEYDYLRLLLRVSFPRMLFSPPIGIIPEVDV